MIHEAMEHETDRVAHILDTIVTRLEAHDKVIHKLASEIPAMVDEYKFVGSDVAIEVRSQSTNLEEITEIIVVSLAGPATLVLGQRRITFPQGTTAIGVHMRLMPTDQRKLYAGSPETPGPAGALGLELMGRERPYLAF